MHYFKKKKKKRQAQNGAFREEERAGSVRGGSQARTSREKNMKRREKNPLRDERRKRQPKTIKQILCGKYIGGGGGIMKAFINQESGRLSQVFEVC